MSRAPDRARPSPPPGLRADSGALWGQLMEDYEGWTPPDLALLQLALEARDRRGECRERIASEGIVLKTPRGAMKPHPLLRVERDASAAVAAIFKQLGLAAAAPASQRAAS